MTGFHRRHCQAVIPKYPVTGAAMREPGYGHLISNFSLP